jgi:WD40 repeat protein
MAPEQAEGKLTAIGPATDVYGLGCILYELLTGAPPFVGESQLDTLRQITALDPLPAGKVRRDLGVALDSIVMKCLQKEPARRYTTALELAEDLDRFLAGEPTRARPSGRWEILYRRIRRQPALFVVLATVATSVLLLLGGRHWYEARLNSDRLLAQRQERVARARDQAHQTHLRYSKSIRQADELIRKFQGKNAQQILESLRPEPGQDDLREFAWHHLMRRCQTERRTLMGHHGDVYYVAFSPRGDLLASAGKDGTVRIWNTATWDLIRKIIASPQEVNVAAFAPDGEALATADDEGKLKLWETATGKLVWERQAHGNDAVIAIFTRDGKTIITGGRTEGKIRFWDRDGRDRGSLVAERLVLESAVLSPDGSTMATGGTHGIKLWDGQSRTLRAVLPRSAGAQGIAFSHDGTKLAAAYESDQVVRVWDVSRRSLDHEDTGHSDAVFGVGFSADDKTIISSGDDGTIRFWDTRTGQPRGVHLGHAGRVWNLTMSPDGRTLVSAGRDGTVKVWDCEGSHEYTALPYTSPAVAGFENDGRILLTLDIEDSASIGRWDTRSGLLVKRTPLGMVGRLHYADFSNDGQTVVILDSDGVVAEWDTTTGRRQHVVAPGTGKVNFLKISSNDRYLAIVVAERLPALVIWDRQNRRSINLPRDHVEAIEFAASGELVLICKNGELVWWDPASGHTRTLSLGSRNNRLLTKFSPDGRLVAFVETGSRSIQLRSAQTLEFVRAFMPEPAEVRSVIFSPDGKTLVVLRVDRTLKLFDTATGEELIRFDGFARTIYWAKFAPDGMTLVTASQSGPGGLGGLLLWRTAGNDP